MVYFKYEKQKCIHHRIELVFLHFSSRFEMPARTTGNTGERGERVQNQT